MNTRTYLTRAVSIVAASVAFAMASFGIPKADAADFKLRIAGAPPAGDIRYSAVDYIARELPKATNGRVAVQVFKGTLGGEREILERLTLGTFDGYMGSTGPLQALTGDPLASLYDVPYLFQNWDHLYRVANSKIGKTLDAQLAAKGIHVLDYVSMGTRAVYTRTTPIKEPADLSGLKIRVMQNPVYLKMYEAFGATPVPMAWPEIYTALQTGVLDGVDGSLSSGLASKQDESVKYVTFLGKHVVIASILAVSQSWWKSLPEGIRTTIQDVAHKAALYEQEKNENYQAKLMEQWRKAGVKFTTVDRPAFAKIAESKVYPMIYQKLGKSVVDEVRSLEK